MLNQWLVYILYNIIYNMFIYITDLLSGGVPVTKEVLRQLRARTFATTSNAFASGTWNNLSCHWSLYIKLCSNFTLVPLPLRISTLSNFLQLYSESVGSYHTILNVFSSIKTMSKINGHIPSDAVLYGIKLFMLGLKRSMSSAVVQKLPVTPELLSRIYNCVDFNNAFHVCMWAVMLFMFFTLFRKSNVLPDSVPKFDPKKQISRANIVYNDENMVVKVTWSKTIQFKQRNLYVPVSKVSGSKLCPISAYDKLLSMVKIPPEYPAFCYSVKGKVFPLTYSLFVKQFRYWLKQIGVKHDVLYSSHSFRRGGATWAFKSGVNPSLIKMQGDWLSDCYLQYVKLDVSDKLETTTKMAQSIINLGI